MFAITPDNFPQAFKALDIASSPYWAYPTPKWRSNFLRAWATEKNDVQLLAALGEDIGGAHVGAYIQWLDSHTPTGITWDNTPEWAQWREIVNACII